MTLDTQSVRLLQDALETLDAGFSHLPDFQPQQDLQGVADILHQVALRLQDNYPYPHPLYAGQMMKPPHPIAHLTYALTLWINPNNHALDGGRASSAMEKEAIAHLADMFGWHAHLGHICSGGTMANLEALWVSGRINPGKSIAASSLAHYTHSRISNVLQLGFVSVNSDRRGKMDVQDLTRRLRGGNIGTVVVTLGTTGAGALDPLPEIIALRRDYNFRVHVDAAYGGYFTLVEELATESRAIFDALTQVDSIVVDPHKHGLQPYGCGCVLFKDPSIGSIYEHTSPYTYFTSDQLHLGEISLECSRPGAAAVALWATQKLLPLCKGGDFSTNLKKSLRAANALYRRLREDERYLTVFPPELDIILWAPLGERASTITDKSVKFFNRAAESNLHLALIELPSALLSYHWPDVEFDRSTVTCLRSCLMKPEHLDWLEEIWRILDRIAG